MIKTSTSKAKAAATKASPARASGSKKGIASKAETRVTKSIAAKAPPASKVSESRKASGAQAAKPAPAPVPAAAAKAKVASAKAAAPKPMTKISPVKAPEKAAAIPAPAPVADPKKSVSQRHGFKTGEHIVYPAHGVGRVVAIEEQEIAGLKLELFVITFEKDKMTLRVPTSKTQSVGMRKLAEGNTVGRAMETLKGRARIKRTMWSRRAQEYEAKINSGDLISIAEVVRDLYRSESQPEQSYSERQLYEAALDRMAREIAAVEKLDDRGAVQRITEVLARSARGLRIERAADDTEDNHQAA